MNPWRRIAKMKALPSTISRDPTPAPVIGPAFVLCGAAGEGGAGQACQMFLNGIDQDQGATASLHGTKATGRQQAINLPPARSNTIGSFCYTYNFRNHVLSPSIGRDAPRCNRGRFPGKVVALRAVA